MGRLGSGPCFVRRLGSEVRVSAIFTFSLDRGGINSRNTFLQCNRSKTTCDRLQLQKLSIIRVVEILEFLQSIISETRVGLLVAALIARVWLKGGERQNDNTSTANTTGSSTWQPDKRLCHYHCQTTTGLLHRRAVRMRSERIRWPRKAEGFSP